MPIATRLTERLDIVHPVISAPMDVIAGGRLDDMYAATLATQVTSPTLDTSALNAATLGAGMTRMV